MSTELAKQQPRLADLLLAKKDSIKSICSKRVDAEEMFKIAQLATTTVPRLNECVATTVLQCVMSAAQLGLRFNTYQQHAYLIPRKNKHSGQYECTLQVGYRGLLSLAWRSPALESVNAFCVYKGERFEVRYGSSPKVIHVPNLDGTMQDTDITHAYAVCSFRGEPMFRVLSRKRLNEIAKTSYTDGDYYRKHYSEWCCARAIKALMKWLPLDGEAEAGFSKLNEDDDTIDTTAIETPEMKALPPPKDVIPDVPIEKHEDDAEFVEGVLNVMNGGKQ